MTKAAILVLGLAALVALPGAAPAQDNSTHIAVNEAVLRQANTIVLRQKLAEARTVEQRGDTAGAAKKTDGGTLVQDGKLLYEMGKLDEAEAKLSEALKIDPDNAGAYYYMNLIQQAKFARESAQHTVDTQIRMAEVEKKWVLPTSK